MKYKIAFHELYVGMELESNLYGKYKILNLDEGATRILIEFIATGYRNKVHAQCIRKGGVKDKYIPSLCGIGYTGKGVGKDDSPISIKAYSAWQNMINRCYSEKRRHVNPTYAGCTVDESWHCFQIFFLWFKEHYKEGFQIDKDVLSPFGKKVYSAKTCEFIPRSINNLFNDNRVERGLYPQGVCYDKKSNKFVANARANNVSFYLGGYDTPLEAYGAYMEKRLELSKNLLEIALKNGDISHLFYVRAIGYIKNQFKEGIKWLNNLQ